MTGIVELRQRRGEAVFQMRSILDKANKEDREMTQEEQAKFDAFDADQVRLKNQIDQEDKVSTALNEINSVSDLPSPSPVVDEQGNIRPLATADYKNSYMEYMRKGQNGIQPNVQNALQVGTDSEGGFIVPEEFETTLIHSLENVNVMRQISTVIRTSSDRNIPVESTRGNAAWTAEEAAYNESDAAFSRVILGAHKLTRIMKVSEELLVDAFFDLENFTRDNFARSFGVPEEAAYVDGSGTGQPTGVADASQLGVSLAGAAAITFDEVIDLYYSLKRIYRGNGTFLASDDMMKLVRKLKDSNGQYLWQPSLQAGEPDMLLNRPVMASDGMPVPTTGNKSLLFGDFSYYWIADRTGVVMQRLNELYAANGQVGFRMNMRVDGKLTLAEAVKHAIQA